MPYDKVRIRFRKSGDLRLVSHLDLMRAFERLLRRASIPIRMTEGFHPAPRMVFAQSLSLGLAGENEVVELELTEDVEPDAMLARLRAATIPGIEFHSATRIPLKVTARPKRAVYTATLEEPHDPHLPERIATLLASGELWCDREKPRPRQIDVRAYIESIDSSDGRLTMSTWLTQEGTIRANELLELLGLPAETPVERKTIDLADELPPEELARVPDIQPRTRALNRLPTPASESPAVETPRETWGATENGPVVE
jgi:radical SAM-linked protein